MQPKLLIATTNDGKIAEFRFLLRSLPFKLTTPSEEGKVLQVEETGLTFKDNAVIKASAYAAELGMMALADDSGIEVEALGGRPGVYSARYGGENLTDEGRVELLLQEMKAVPWEKRTAAFRAVIAVAWPDGRILTREGIMNGTVNLSPVGGNGFGYDPIFYLSEYKATTAQLTSEQKNLLSHRGKAAEGIVKALLSQFR